MYLLCIDTTDKIVEEIHSFDAISGEIICIEGSEQDTQAHVMVK